MGGFRFEVYCLQYAWHMVTVVDNYMLEITVGADFSLLYNSFAPFESTDRNQQYFELFKITVLVRGSLELKEGRIITHKMVFIMLTVRNRHICVICINS